MVRCGRSASCVITGTAVMPFITPVLCRCAARQPRASRAPTIPRSLSHMSIFNLPPQASNESETTMEAASGRGPPGDAVGAAQGGCCHGRQLRRYLMSQTHKPQPRGVPTSAPAVDMKNAAVEEENKEKENEKEEGSGCEKTMAAIVPLSTDVVAGQHDTYSVMTTRPPPSPWRAKLRSLSRLVSEPRGSEASAVTVRGLLEEARFEFTREGVPEPRLSAEYLLAKALSMRSRSELRMNLHCLVWASAPAQRHLGQPQRGQQETQQQQESVDAGARLEGAAGNRTRSHRRHAIITAAASCGQRCRHRCRYRRDPVSTRLDRRHRCASRTPSIRYSWSPAALANRALLKAPKRCDDFSADSDARHRPVAGVKLWDPQSFLHDCGLRLRRMPIQFILGEWDFRHLTLRVAPPTLIPRPETEQLVELVLEDIRTRNVNDVTRRKDIDREHLSDGRRRANRSTTSQPSTPLRILDVGCGSGAIGLAIAQECLQRVPRRLSSPRSSVTVEVTAVDPSAAAVSLTKSNARLAGLDDPSVFQVLHASYDDLLPSGSKFRNYFDIIVSNPPYVPTARLPFLEPELRYEDAAALDGGPDGLNLGRRIAQTCHRLLRRSDISLGRVYMELDADQPQKLAMELTRVGDCLKGGAGSTAYATDSNDGADDDSPTGRAAGLSSHVGGGSMWTADVFQDIHGHNRYLRLSSISTTTTAPTTATSPLQLQPPPLSQPQRLPQRPLPRQQEEEGI
eukprot:GHVU01060994.1.p1 GENE.GHVU01060994.1~~GHVU01060994.1.p1  ORF type:complete len:739 (+),score=71.73 GHVU01060994.1:1456-3672(+)